MFLRIHHDDAEEGLLLLLHHFLLLLLLDQLYHNLLNDIYLHVNL
jgi:hypothetical protein